MTTPEKYTPEARVRASALGSLAMREHSCDELRTKLINKNHDPQLVDALILSLLADNLISDQRFAEAYWRTRSNKGYGPARISKELQMKGVSTATIQQAESDAEIDFYAVVTRVYQKKFKVSVISDYKEKAKRQAFLYRRGFDTDLIKHVID